MVGDQTHHGQVLPVLAHASFEEGKTSWVKTIKDHGDLRFNHHRGNLFHLQRGDRAAKTKSKGLPGGPFPMSLLRWCLSSLILSLAKTGHHLLSLLTLAK